MAKIWTGFLYPRADFCRTPLPGGPQTRIFRPYFWPNFRVFGVQVRRICEYVLPIQHNHAYVSTTYFNPPFKHQHTR